MANFMADTLKVKTVYVLDDSGAYGVGLADAFQKQAEKNGIKVLGRDRLDPKAADYSAVLTKIKASTRRRIYYGGVGQAGVKLAKQAYDIIPNMIKAGGDGIQGADFLTGAGFPAVEGWYATIAAPARHRRRQRRRRSPTASRHASASQPDDYSITCYVGALVIIDAVKQLVAEKKEVTRDNVRDAIQGIKLTKTLLGPIAFDANGDISEPDHQRVPDHARTRPSRSTARPTSTSTSAWRRWPERSREQARRASAGPWDGT